MGVIVNGFGVGSFSCIQASQAGQADSGEVFGPGSQGMALVFQGEGIKGVRGLFPILIGKMAPCHGIAGSGSQGMLRKNIQKFLVAKNGLIKVLQPVLAFALLVNRIRRQVGLTVQAIRLCEKRRGLPVIFLALLAVTLADG